VNDLLYVAITIIVLPYFSCWSRGSRSLSAENWVGLIAAIILTVYLVFALVRPEKF